MSKFIIDSREVHKDIGSKSKHADWIHRFIRAHGLVEGVDYIQTRKGTKKIYKLSQEALEKGSRPRDVQPTYKLHNELGVRTHPSEWIRRRREELDLELTEDTLDFDLEVLHAYESKEYLKEVVKKGLEMKNTLATFSGASISVPDGFSIVNGKLVVDSLYIAEKTGKRHKDITRSIRNEIQSINFSLQDLAGADLRPPLEKILSGVKETYYIDVQGKPRIYYTLDERASLHMMMKLSPVFRAYLADKFVTYKEQIECYYKSLSLSKHFGFQVGYIYVLSDGLGYKVGFSKDPLKRVRELSTGSRVKIDLLYISKPCSNYAEIEKKVHNTFKDFRVNGEWFEGVLLQDIVDIMESQEYKLTSKELQ